MTIVLASASPRRQELLKTAGIDFIVQPANIPEIRLDSESPKTFAERMAREKAKTVWASFQNLRLSKITQELPLRARSEFSSGAAVVLGADTVVVVSDEVLGKPADEDDAARMLNLLSGRQHSVTTAVCLWGKGFEDVRSETTAVCFRALAESEIAAYVESGEPMDKAGAYAIQGMASRWISRIEGDYNNVVGLPVDLVQRMLREHGMG
jgi:septum formation protein